MKSNRLGIALFFSILFGLGYAVAFYRFLGLAVASQRSLIVLASLFSISIGWSLAGMYMYYSPRLQRFIADDPIGFGGGDVNLSAYVRNDPVSKTDPLGLYVKNCTDQPKKVKPEHGGDPPFILPPMTECPDCHPDVVGPLAPDAPWTKVPSPERWPSDVTIYPAPGSGMRVVCSWLSICGYPPFRPYIPAPGSADDRNMRADPDWWKTPLDLPAERKRPLGRKDCEQ